MKASYDAALARVLAHEGGYTNHPSDPGGPTNFGITIFDARKHWKPNATAADVKAMPLAVAKGIYRRRYWDAQRCDELPAGVDYAVFDYGVNSGIGRSGKVLRRLLDLPADTGVVGDAVIAAARTREPRALVEAICDERLRFLERLRTWPVFGGGWGRRVAEVRRVALAMASGTPPAVSRRRRGGALAAGTAAAGTIAAGTAATGGAAGLAHPQNWSVAILLAIAAAVVIAVLFVGAIWLVRRARRRPAAGKALVADTQTQTGG
ncbi:glycosyl hydrolase 108 family protein [Rhodoplanes sp.]|uniref:glycoside hydrolase family 108 protein n=1 Tax=Rhodoplanes sp. TaxID=1968906 RepID=UPI0025F833CD|nr:glycosyl hydrolase 108 family protein [Rhodoplanes sp.]